MKILVVGGTGLIGSAITARLASRGHTVIAASRSGGRTGHVSVDIAHATLVDWYPLLSGVDAVVNCAGVLQDAPGDSTASVHHDGAATLFKACESIGIRRVIHFSAIGVDRATPTEFSRSKRA